MHRVHIAGATAVLPGRRFARRTAGALLVLSSAMLGACSPDKLLQVNTPDIVTPENLSGEAGIAVLRAGAFGDLALAVGGAAAGHGSTPGLAHHVSAFTDEVTYSGTFPTRRLFDERRLLEDNGDLNVLYRNIHRARASAEIAAAVVEKVSATDVRRAEMLSLAGFAHVFLAENFCSGLTISTAAETGELTFGAPLTTQQVFEKALGFFDLAVAASPSGSRERYIASVGKGRTLVNLNRYADAATAVAAVPTTFRVDLEYATSSARQQNGLFALSGVDRQYSVSERESPNGLPYRSMSDPRVPWTRTPGEVGQDGATAFFLQRKYTSPAASIALATGIEARLIEAEAELAAGRVASFTAIHTALRASVGLPPVDVSAMTAAERVDFQFQERAFWLYLTAHRLGDMRRLVGQYGRAAVTVFPTGPYFKGGTYGTDANFVLPISEQNNPNSRGCENRNR